MVRTQLETTRFQQLPLWQSSQTLFVALQHVEELKKIELNEGGPHHI
jgi:hypothetical protein